MLKLLFKILQSLPAFQKLLSEYFAAERAELDERISYWQESWRGTQNDLTDMQKRAESAERTAYLAQEEAASLAHRIRERDAEIERLQNETQQRLKAVAAMDSESVFNASLFSARGQDGSPLTERELPVDSGRR